LKKLKDDKLSDNSKILLYKGTNKISDLDIFFVLPSTTIDLCEGGSNKLVSNDNFESYTELVFENLVGKSITPYIEAFRTGFNKVFEINNLRLFSSSEIEDILSGSNDELWDQSTLNENIIPDHGYDRASSQYLNFLSILKDFNPLNRKKFLQFVTGCPRLPLGGIIT
jgi:E3 ubiquitin-protein ligase TRIP12